MAESVEKRGIVQTERTSFQRKVLFFLSAGHYVPGSTDAYTLEQVTKYIMFNIFLVIGILIFVPIAIYVGLDPTTPRITIVLNTTFCLSFSILFAVARTRVSLVVPASILVYSFAFFVSYMLILHPYGGVGTALWSFILPPLAYSVLGQLGFFPCLIASVSMIYAFANSPNFYSEEFAFRCAVIFVFIMMYSGYTTTRTRSLGTSLMRGRVQLQQEINEIEVMKDNLEAGVFIVDESLVIQPHYSKSLVKILDKEDLTGVNFAELLAKSLKEREVNLFKEYLDMIRLNSFDLETLKDINPLSKFSYMTESLEEKTLSATFSLLERTGEEKQIFCVIRDITAEAALEAKLMAEEQFRQSEMKAMFEVMHVAPKTLHEFLNDLDYEFERMNEVLKDKTREQRTVLWELHQGMHSMKSNALIIGMESAADRFHEFENKLASMLETDEGSYDSLLEVVFEMERVMGIVDNLREVVKKMDAFGEGSKQIQSSSDTLLQAIQNTINKGIDANEKGVILNATKVEWDKLDANYRRIIKDILLQFTRNSLAHGIEKREVRLEKGKKEDGVISLSVVKTDENKIVMEYTDDGAGIDFEKVKKQAIEKNLIPEGEDPNSKGLLIKALFSPGFSTADGVSLQAGRGVGLSFVSSRIKEVKGTLNVKSAPGKGTKFIVEIPYSSAV